MTQPQTPAPGWYPDPAGSGGHRWWNGMAWSEHVQPAAATLPAPPAVPVAPMAAATVGYASIGSSMFPAAPAGPGATQPAWTPMSSPVAAPARRNHYANVTFAVAALYILLAVATHFVLIGVVPLLMAARSLRAQEKLAPFAMGAAILAVVVALVTISGH